MEPNTVTSQDERAIRADQYSVTRDYCYMRMKMLSEAPGLIGITVEDLNEISRDFHAAQINVLASMSKAAQSAEFSHTVSFEQKFLSLKHRVMQASKESLSSNKNCESGLAKLPKITMKPFDGKLENWVSFKELYDSLIHNRDLAEVEKLHYLLSSVQGTAYDLIKNFPLTGSSYKAAYQALHKYYDRKRNIATTYYENLLKCESIRNKSGSELERIHRTFNENLAILARYDLPNQDFILFQMVWSKLDSVTREAFELQLGPDVDIPLFEDIMDFLDKRSRALENCYGYHNPTKQITSRNKTSLLVPPQQSCEFCPNEGHMGEKCPTFLKLSPAGRFQDVKEKRLCILCLQPSHSVKKCTVKVLCCQCNQRHHTLLHFEEPAPTLSTSQEHEEAPPVALAAYSSNADALFPTAVVLVKNNLNAFVKVRILLDSASACNFMSLSCAHRLGLNIHPEAQSVNGIGRVFTNTLGSVKCELGSRTQNSAGSLVVEAAVLQTICQDMPAGHIDVSSWEHLKGLELADPEFNSPGPIDMLVSVNFLSLALKPGLIKGEPGQAIAIPTIFGWIVMGECTIGTDFSRLRNNHNIRKDCFLVSNLSNLSLGNLVTESWEMANVESPKSTPVLSTTEPLVISKNIEPFGAITKQLLVGQPFPLIETQGGIPSDCWHHVPRAGNPVDHCSRGLLPVELTPCQSWWSGPRGIGNPPKEWPRTSLSSKREAEVKERKALGIITFVCRILNRSFFSHIVSIFAFFFWFCRNLRSSSSGGSINALSTTTRITEVTLSLIKHVQEALRRLYPSADVNGLLKQPLLLLRDRHLAHIFLEELCCRCLHPSTQTLRSLRLPDSWIRVTKREVRSMVLSCLMCFRAEPRSSTPLVTTLGSCRLKPIGFLPPPADFAHLLFAFFALVCGHSRMTQKGCVHIAAVCTVIKTVHLELASDLTLKVYLACLRRLINRGKHCSRLESDEGANFVEVSNLLKDLTSQASQTERIELNFDSPASRLLLELSEIRVQCVKIYHACVIDVVVVQRHKWVDARDNIVVGAFVLIFSEQRSPIKWKVGQVTQLHSGTDNVCHVVSLKTQSGDCKRPVVKLSVLPVPQDVNLAPPSN